MKALATLIAASLVFANAALAAPGAGAPAAAAAPVKQVITENSRSRAEVRAEAVEAMKQHRTTLEVQLAQYR